MPHVSEELVVDRLFASIAIIWLSFIAAVCIVLTIRWPWLHDAQVFHYIVFLLQHGFQPYRDITDINLPGSYFQEWLGIAIFGGSDLGWRLYDVTVLALATLLCVEIAKPYGRSAGYCAGVLFSLSHFADGPWYLGERDLFIALLVLAGYAGSFRAVRREHWVELFAAALAFGIALTIKPVVLPAALLLLFYAWWKSCSRNGRLVSGGCLILLGLLLPLFASLFYLHAYGAVESFVQSFRTISVFYRGIAQAPLYYLVRQSCPLPLAPFLVLAAIVFALRLRRQNTETLLLLAGALLCLAAYFFQGKGYVYHRYPFLALSLLWGMIVVASAAGKSFFQTKLSLAALCLALFAAGPYLGWLTWKQRSGSSPGHPWNETTDAMLEDLSLFEPAYLDRNIQCLDTDAGCYSALFRARLVQTTGEMGDHLLFWPSSSPVVTSLRRRFFAKMQATPPHVIVLSNKWFAGRQSFALLHTWPEFEVWLKEHYFIRYEHEFRQSPKELDPVAYRIYEARH